MSKLYTIFKTILLVTISIYIFDKTRMYVYGHSNAWNLTAEIISFSLYLLYSTALGFANYWVVAQLNEKFSWREKPKKRVIYGVIGALFISMIVIVFLRLFTVMVLGQKDWTYFKEHERLSIYFFSLIITMIVVLVFYVIYFYKAITKRQIAEQKTIAQTEIAKYESLKSQIDPHFLFNSLNVLTSLIEENPNKAEKFTTKLSKVYRYVLEQKEKTLVPLQEELNFAKVYIELLKMRFEEAIQFTLPKKEIDSNYKIVPLSLQLLLENAVKHNAISEEIPLQITITIAKGSLVVSNNYHKKKLLNKGTGVGLLNIIDRYALLTQRQVTIHKTKEIFKVALPLLTQKTNIMKTSINSEEKKYDRAKKKVEKMKNFYANLVSYIGVNTFLIFLNYYTGWAHKWFVYPLIGWGVGLLFHYFEAFEYYPFLGRNWEEKKIKELMDEDSEEMWE